MNNTFLKVMGIIMIIAGAISIVINVIVNGIVAVFAYIADSVSGGEISTGVIWVGIVVGIVAAVAQLIAGIMGVKGGNDVSKAGKAVTWGIIAIVLAILYEVLFSIAGADFSIFGLILSIALPIVFLIAAFLAKKQAA